MATRIADRPRLVWIPDVPYGAGGGRELLLDILRPDPAPAEPMPVVMEIHGGGWEGGARDAGRNRPFAMAGYLTVSIEYRLSGEAIFPAQIEDAKAAIRWVRASARELGADAARIAAWGHSAGGHLSALLATTPNVAELEGKGGSAGESSAVQAAVDLSGPTGMLSTGNWLEHDDSPVARLVGGPLAEKADLVRLASPAEHARSGAAPTLIIHGADDDLVPVGQAELLRDRLRDAGVEHELVAYPTGGHGLDGRWPDIHGRMLAWFDRHLRA